MKEFLELLGESAATLTRNKLRTGLAILGIVIGIGSVIALVSLGQASQQAIQNQIQALGANLLTVSPGAASQGEVKGAAGSGSSLSNDDADAITSSGAVPSVVAVSPEISGRSQVTVGSNNANLEIIGAPPVYEQVHAMTIASGSFFTEQDQERAARVIVLGPTAAADLFGEGVDPIGKNVRVSAVTMKVIGITESKGGRGGFDPDSSGFVPLSTAQKQLYGQTYLNSIALTAASSDVMEQAQAEVAELLASRHDIPATEEPDFRIVTQSDVLGTATATTETLSALLTAVAAISLLVGGIGIMNIMLVTVTERTREIGLRKALGAKRKTIITQFLIESVMLTFVGGIAGIAGGIGASWLYAHFTDSLFVISGGSVLLAFVVSAGIGILFGWYPARRAASLQPMEALRYE
jgi:putative ABC transport system permease protein